jgi:hypothetical protein
MYVNLIMMFVNIISVVHQSAISFSEAVCLNDLYDPSLGKADVNYGFIYNKGWTRSLTKSAISHTDIVCILETTSVFCGNIRYSVSCNIITAPDIIAFQARKWQFAATKFDFSYISMYINHISLYYTDELDNPDRFIFSRYHIT